MKKHLFILFSCGALAWNLAGCASAGREGRDTSHTLEVDSPLDIGLPFADGIYTAAGLFDRSLVCPVKGLSPTGVMQLLGRPTQRLRSDLWVYWQYYSKEKAAETSGHDTLVVVFARGEVSAMKLVNGDDLRTHLAGGGQSRGSNRL